MSTRERYGTIVWQAIVDMNAEWERGERDSYWFRAGDVASRAGVSIPTARKYLRILAETNDVAVVGDNSGQYYTIVGSF